MCDRSSDPTQYDGAAPDDASSRASSRSGAALTPRQREALAAYAETGEYDAAARRIGANLQTYKNTLQVVYRKLGVTGAIDAFRVLGWLSARERPSALDVETLARAMVNADLDDIPEPDDILDSMPEARQIAERIAAEYARLTEPDAGEKFSGWMDPADCADCTPDTTEATPPTVQPEGGPE